MQLLDFTLSLNLAKANGEVDQQAIVFLSPQHAKALLHVLAENVNMYESLFGEINLEPNKSKLEGLASEGKIQIAHIAAGNEK
jgi:hypothetical protein